MTQPSKDDLRQTMRAKRRRVLSEVEATIQGQAQTLLPPLLGAGRLGLYWPLAGEIDLRDLRQTLGERLALPAVERATQTPELGADQQPPKRLVYRPWIQEQPLEADGCGIPAPAASTPPLKPADLCLLLVPALAIDGRGYRLGYGGGWYDRLRSDPAWARVPALAVLPAACRLEHLPHDPWDIPLAGWLSEDGLHWIETPKDPGLER